MHKKGGGGGEVQELPQGKKKSRGPSLRGEGIQKKRKRREKRSPSDRERSGPMVSKGEKGPGK